MQASGQRRLGLTRRCRLATFGSQQTRHWSTLFLGCRQMTPLTKSEIRQDGALVVRVAMARLHCCASGFPRSRRWRTCLASCAVCTHSEKIWFFAWRLRAERATFSSAPSSKRLTSAVPQRRLPARGWRSTPPLAMWLLHMIRRARTTPVRQVARSPQSPDRMSCILHT